MGMGTPGEWLVARDKDEYVSMAVRVAKNEGGERDRVVGKIMQNLGKLYRQKAAVEGWTALLERMARKEE